MANAYNRFSGEAMLNGNAPSESLLEVAGAPVCDECAVACVDPRFRRRRFLSEVEVFAMAKEL
jgi:hypothetical protein